MVDDTLGISECGVKKINEPVFEQKDKFDESTVWK